MTIKNTESGINAEDYRNREMVDRVNTTAAAVLGVTLGCAQCHSHKYDPFTQQEYYRFYAFFNNVEEIEIDLPSSAAEKATYAEASSAYYDKWLALQARQRITDNLAKLGPEKSRAAIEAGRRHRRRSNSPRNEAWNRWASRSGPRRLRTPSRIELAAPDHVCRLYQAWMPKQETSSTRPSSAISRRCPC